jgi:hypothetical protein
LTFLYRLYFEKKKILDVNITTDFKKKPVFNKWYGKKKYGSHTFIFFNIAENVTPLP